MRIKFLTVLFILFFGVTARADDSLLESTIYTGLPITGVIAGIFVYEIEANNRTSYDRLFSNFKRGFTRPPVWDKNPWYVNYVGHPEAGAEYYLFARNRNYSPLASFLYSTSLSVVWEYGMESWIGAKPSMQDLIFTSTLGSIFGELRYYFKKRLTGDSMASKIGIVVLDPVEAIHGVLE